MRDLLESPSHRRLFLLVVVAFLASRAYLILGLDRPYTDLKTYFVYAFRSTDLDQTPYADFSFEYPPLAYGLIVLPRLGSAHDIPTPPWRIQEAEFAFDFRTRAVRKVEAADLAQGDMSSRLLPARQVEGAYQEYVARYRALLLLLDAACLLLVIGILKELGAHDGYRIAAAFSYVASTFLLGHVLLDRLDLPLLLTILGSLQLWLRAIRLRSRLLHVAAYLLLGAGAALKLVTVVMVPFLALASLERRGVRSMLEGVAAFTVGTLVPFAIAYGLAGSSIARMFEYHEARGIQIESIHSSIQMLLAPLGLAIQARPDFGSVELWSSLVPALRILSTVLILAGMAWLGLRGLWMWRKRQYVPGAEFAAFSVLILLAFSKVLSVQFFLFGIPLLLILGARCSERVGKAIVVLSPVVAALSTCIFPYLWMRNLNSFPSLGEYTLMRLHWLPCSILVLRNLLFVVLVASVGVAVSRMRNERTSTP